MNGSKEQPNSQNGSRETTSKALQFLSVVILCLVLTKARSILFNKIFTNFLTLEEFGTYMFLVQTALFYVGFAQFDLPYALFRYVVRYDTEMSKEKSSNSFLTALVLVTVFQLLLVGVTLGLFLVGFSFIGLQGLGTTILLVLILAYFQLLNTLLLAVVRARSDAIGYFSLDTGSAYLGLIMTVLLGIVFKGKVIGIMYGLILAYGVFVIIVFLRFVLQSGLGRISFAEARNLSAFAAPGAIVSIVGTVSVYLVYWLLNWHEGKEAIALLSIGLMIANFISFGDYAVTMAYPTMVVTLYEKKKHTDLKRLMKKVTRIYSFFLVAQTYLIIALSPVLILIFTNESYLDASIVVAIYSFGLMAQAGIRTTCYGAPLKYKTKEVGCLNIMVYAATIILTIFLIPFYGLIGGVIGLAFPLIFKFILGFVYSQKLYYVPYDYGKIGMIATLGIGTFVVGIFITCLAGSNTYLTLILFFVLYIIMAFAFKIVSIEEIIEVTKLFLKSSNITRRRK